MNLSSIFGKLLKKLMFYRLHDVFHGQIDKTEMCLSVVYEKCDWDLYEFLRTIPRDMGDHQCRHIAKQVDFVSIWKQGFSLDVLINVKILRTSEFSCLF